MPLKAGQQYIICRPPKEERNKSPGWITQMDDEQLDGRVITITSIEKNSIFGEFIKVKSSSIYPSWTICEAWLKPAKMFVEVNGKRTPIALPYDQAQMLAEKTGGTICQ